MVSDGALQVLSGPMGGMQQIFYEEHHLGASPHCHVCVLLAGQREPTRVTQTVHISLLVLQALEILEGSRTPAHVPEMVYFVIWLES